MVLVDYILLLTLKLKSVWCIAFLYLRLFTLLEPILIRFGSCRLYFITNTQTQISLVYSFYLYMYPRVFFLNRLLRLHFDKVYYPPLSIPPFPYTVITSIYLHFSYLSNHNNKSLLFFLPYITFISKSLLPPRDRLDA